MKQGKNSINLSLAYNLRLYYHAAMPELPEVQTTVNGLNRTIRGLTIADAWTDYGSAFHKGKDSIKDGPYFRYFRNEVVGSRVTRIERLAKNILIHIEKSSEKSSILIHMKMTGHLLYGHYLFNREKKSWLPAAGEKSSLSDPFNRFVHFVLVFSNGKNLALSDMRKFAKVTLIKEKDLEKTAHLENIGPDPLKKDFDFKSFKKRLELKPVARIKQILMDQSILAGIGNIYSDEALFRAGINPEEKVKNIPPELLKKLHAAILTVLKKGIDFGGDSMSDYRNIEGERGRFQEHHRAYRRTGKRCERAGCKGTIIRKIVGGRSAHFCDRHQRLIVY